MKIVEISLALFFGDELSPNDEFNGKRKKVKIGKWDMKKMRNRLESVVQMNRWKTVDRHKETGKIRIKSVTWRKKIMAQFQSDWIH